MEALFFNGINGATGEYLLSGLEPHDISKIALGEKIDKKHLDELKWRHNQVTEATLAVKEGVDPKKLAESGWGVIFSSDSNTAIKEALKPLLEHRRAQAASQKPAYYKEYAGADGYRLGESKQQFLARHGAGPGPVDPEKVPYYLLIVGDPEIIPFRFQYQLDVQYAVGRIHFDTIEEYARYAQSVVEAETKSLRSSRTAAFFGVRNPGDRATKRSAESLVQPLTESLTNTQPEWKIATFLAQAATKAQLSHLLGGEGTPSLLFTASHGMAFPSGDPRQLPHQGALLCQDWPGPLAHQGPIPEEFYFSAEDVGSDARVLGLISFHFACYGAGSPKFDDFAHQAFSQPVSIAPHAFLSRLPQRLLSHSKGAALAVVGHVERVWDCSFSWPGADKQLTVFESALTRLMSGHPIGSALEPFNERYAELSSDLSAELEEVKWGKTPDDVTLAGMWTANNDARSYIIVGDPAVSVASML